MEKLTAQKLMKRYQSIWCSKDEMKFIENYIDRHLDFGNPPNRYGLHLGLAKVMARMEVLTRRRRQTKIMWEIGIAVMLLLFRAIGFTW